MIGDECTLRSTAWDGPAPDVGDLLTTRAGSWYLVTQSRAGAGIGHYTLRCVRLGKRRPREADDVDRAIFRWAWARRERAYDGRRSSTCRVASHASASHSVGSGQDRPADADRSAQ